MLVTTLEADNYLGRILTGRIETGAISVNRVIKALDRNGKEIERTRVTKLLAFRGLARVPVARVEAGDIVAIAGLPNATVADTLCDISVEAPIQAQPIDPPTLAITLSVNDSPLAGREGDKVQSRVIRDRLLREAEGNVAIKVRETGEGAYEVAGRGELQLGVLIEQMRREGFELSISRPRVLYQTDEKGQRLEPMEEVTIDVDDPYAGVVIEKISMRKGELQDMRPTGAGKTRLVFFAPSRGLIGYHGEFLTDTRGTGVINRMFHGYAPFKGAIEGRRNGVLVSTGDGEAVAYAIWYLEERGKMFVIPGTKIYQGMIVGEHSRDNDLDVNPLKAKQLTQHPHHVEGRSRALNARRPDDPGTGHRLHPGRRAGRGHAAIHPPAQTRADAAPAQAREGRNGGLTISGDWRNSYAGRGSLQFDSPDLSPETILPLRHPAGSLRFS